LAGQPGRAAGGGLRRAARAGVLPHRRVSPVAETHQVRGGGMSGPTLEERLAAVGLTAGRAPDRGGGGKVFSRYMHYHNAFEDERIIDELWVRRGTEGVRSQYNDDGVYTDWDTIMEYHRGRPHPVGKLILHYTTTPVIEVAADGSTAKGLWLM